MTGVVPWRLTALPLVHPHPGAISLRHKSGLLVRRLPEQRLHAGTSLTADAVSSSLFPAPPFTHGPLDTSQVTEFSGGFICILILPTVAASDDTIL